MTSLPTYRDSRLFKALSKNATLAGAVESMRPIAARVGREVANQLPEYTDHSIAHMDALWAVADSVLTTAETESLTPDEAFLLAASFYVHDLGMAIAATPVGLTRLKESSEYKAELEMAQRVNNLPPEKAEALAIRAAARKLHAHEAIGLATQLIPGVNQYLIESAVVRTTYCATVGLIAASHHWPLTKVASELGVRGRVPFNTGEGADVAYVACLLRVIDFAHINRERASHLERALRSSIAADSVVHWDAQSNITGPNRDGNQLVYGSTQPSDDIEAWWLFYELASGLENEIRGVSEYLLGRSESRSRFSLDSVRGVSTPEAFSRFVLLGKGISPVDVRLQPNSMERLVELLGGKSLYGNDKLVPIRELLQNARDAISLRRTDATARSLDLVDGKIVVEIKKEPEGTWLCVSDNGTGMSRLVMTRYLVGVASNYWKSADFYSDFSAAAAKGFSPAGRFGIGFLSVFMLGNRVEVETEKYGGPRFLLRLRGVGRRGELIERSGTGQVGTQIRVMLDAECHGRVSHLADVVRARAPMLEFPIIVRTPAESGTNETTIKPGWWKDVTPEELQSFTLQWFAAAYLGKREEKSRVQESRGLRGWDTSLNQISGWPAQPVESAAQDSRFVSLGLMQASAVLCCSRGLAVSIVEVEDAFGVCDVGDIELTASRAGRIDAGEELWEYGGRYRIRRGAQSDSWGMQDRAAKGLRAGVARALDGLPHHGMVLSRMKMIANVAERYGTDLLEVTKLPWIPVAEPPGNVLLKTPVDFATSVATERELVVATNGSHATAYKQAALVHRNIQVSNLRAVAFEHDPFHVDYSKRSELEKEHETLKFEGSLDHLLELAGSSVDELPLLWTMLGLLSRAWSVDKSNLATGTWHLNAETGLLWALARRVPEK